MRKPALVIMAAGIGSRYGGLKQIDPIGPNGEIIMDYSIYDALKAGFGKVVFIIKKEIEEAFKEKIGNKISGLVETEFVFQSVKDLSAGFEAPEGRSKPWGTGHAVMSCRNVIDTSFAVINADDFYGRSSFQVLADFLKSVEDTNKYQYSMVGFVLENTLTENGHVARGVCSVNKEGYLTGIAERTRIEKFDASTKYTEDGANWITIPQGSFVSMNTWGFTPSIFKELEQRFPKFLADNRDRLEKAEYFLPNVIGDLISENKANVKVLQSSERWYGVTYQEDKPMVKQALKKMIQQGKYPEDLWRGYKGL
jgi:UTP-glucose-1-phosphate uridylyltransferase